MADSIGKRIMSLRGKNETQKELADALGVSRELVKSWENGTRKVTIDNLLKLSSYFEVSCDYLLGLADKNNSTNDEKLRMASEYTGLSNEAIESIRHNYNEDFKANLSEVLSNRKFLYIISCLGELHRNEKQLHNK